MSKKLNKKVPKLRFPEFKGDWNEKRLEELFSEFKSGYGITSDDITEHGTYPVFGGNGLRGYTESFTHNGFYFLIGRQGALCGNINRTNGKAYISEHAIACKANDTSDTEWLAQRLDYYNLNRLSESSAQPGLSVNKLLRFKLFVPSKKEQEKIASFLGAVDRRLTQLRRKQELLQTYKRGVMQKIFSQKIRFKDAIGSPFPDWEKKKLREITKINQGLQIAISDRLTYQVEGSYFYITNEFLKPDSQTRYYILNPPKRVICEKDDILMTRTGNTGQVVTDVVGAFHNNFFKISYDRNKINKKFLLEFLRRDTTQHKILSLAGTSTIPDLNHDDFYNLEIFIPVSVEQEKIANFLTAIDCKIEILTRQIDKNEKFKKGLLPKLFI